MAYRQDVKCCFISTKAYPVFNPDCEASHGGAELQVAYLATELATRESVDVSCIVGDFGQARCEIREGVRLLRAFNPEGSEPLLTKLIQSWKYWTLLRDVHPDVVVTTTSGPVALVAAVYARVKGAKHLHRTAHERDTDLSLRSGKSLTRIAYLIGIRLAHSVITQSEAHKRKLQSQGRKATVVRNVFPLSAQRPMSSEERNNVLWVGRYVDFKQPEAFLALARELPDVSFVMICQPGATGQSRYEEFSSKAAEVPNLTFLPGLPLESTTAYFQRALALVSTSTAEGFPNTFLQALSAGTPLVSLNVNPDRMFDRYSLGFHCGGSFTELFQKVRILSQDKDAWEVRSRDAQAYVKEWHDPKRNVQALHDLIIGLFNPRYSVQQGKGLR